MEKETAPAATEAELKKSEIKATTKIESENLVGLSHFEIAIRIYYLISNSDKKSFEDFYEIGNLLGTIAANYAE